MGTLNDSVENGLLDQLFNKSAMAEATIWLGVCTSDTALTDASDLSPSEPTAASYGRQDTSAATWTAASGGALSNGVAVEFTLAVQSWCTLYGFAGFDASVAGNVLFCGTLPTARDITVNDSCRFAVGALDVALD